MTEYDFMAKDEIRLCLLDEVVNQNSIIFRLFLESDGEERNFVTIRTGNDTYRFNNFSVTEDVSKNMVIFKPIVVGCYSYFIVNNATPVTVEAIKAGATTVDRQFVLGPGENKIEFVPRGLKQYLMRLPDSQENLRIFQDNEALEKSIQEIRQQVDGISAKNERLINDKSGLQTKLEILQTEYDKNYSSYEADIEEIKSKFDIDEQILKYYLADSNNDIVPIEELISKCQKDIDEMENQIRVFVQAKQQKTDEIEEELKIGKRE